MTSHGKSVKASSPLSCTAAANRRGNFAHRVTVIILASWSALLGLSAALSLLGTLYFDQANLFLADWKNDSQQPEAKAVEFANAAIARAISLHPFPPSNYYTAQGRIYEWQHYSQPSGHPEAATTRANALAAYQTAVSLNPKWAVHHLDIAGVMIRLGYFNEKLAETLNTALLLAPYRPNVLIRIVELGLMEWNALPPSAQQVVTTALLNASTSDNRVFKQILTITTHLNQEKVICDLLVTKNIELPTDLPKSCLNS